MRHPALDFVQRHGRGLWGLALLSASIVPVALHCAALHRGHWYPGPSADFWRQFGGWAAQAWGTIGILVIAGWVAGARPAAQGASRWIRVRLGLQIAGLGWIVWLGAALPGFVWATRLGVPAMFDAASSAAGILAVTALLAGAVGSWRAFAGLFVGCIAGPALLWIAA